MPGLRRPRHTQRRAARTARSSRCDRHAAQQVHLRLGHRLLVALHLLHEDVRLPQHPWTRERHRHGRQNRQSRPLGLGGDGRRRLAGHRRQPLHPCHPPQRQPQRHSLQQRDLRPHERTVLPDFEARQDHQDFALRHGRKTVQPGRAGDRRERHVLRPLDRRRSKPHERVSRRSGQASGHVGYGVSPELRDLQR